MDEFKTLRFLGDFSGRAEVLAPDSKIVDSGNSLDKTLTYCTN